MLQRIMAMPQQVRDAWALVQSAALPGSHAGAANIVICGMGGSAIGGDLTRTLVEQEARVPITLVRGYDLPAFVGSNTLVIISELFRRHGGDAVLLRAGAEGICPGCSRSRREDRSHRAQQADFPLIQFRFPGQPREAIGYSALLMLGVLGNLGYVRTGTTRR